MKTQELRSSFGHYRTIAVVGGQFGDEAKGKFVDVFAEENANIVARGTGGANAGHTISTNGIPTVLHLVPSGILHDKKGVTTVCGSGMVIDPRALMDELSALRKLGVTSTHFNVAHNASLVLPQHKVEEQLRERQAGRGKIGTTGRGIGPAYADKALRVGLTVNDLLDRHTFADKLRANLATKDAMIKGSDPALLREIADKSKIFGFHDDDFGSQFDIDEIVSAYLECGDFLEHAITDTDAFMRASRDNGKTRIVLEGAQGVLLSVEDGAHPFVTSSDSSLAGLTRGVGLRESDVDLTIVVAKAFYMTRVGSGPFPTELGGVKSDEFCNAPGSNRESEAMTDSRQLDLLNSPVEYSQGVGIRLAGEEYGATSGRPRRTGWLDLALLRYVLGRTGGNVMLALTKLDVLDDCKEIKLCNGYEYIGPDLRVGQRRLISGTQLSDAIVKSEVMRHCRPIYQTFDGWLQPTGDITEIDDLPDKLVSMIGAVELATKTKVALVSVGPNRDQTILLG